MWLGERADAQALIAAADIGVAPSHEEVFSNSLIEKMAHGLPVIATRIGGNIDAVVDGETGWLVPVSDAVALGEAITALHEKFQLARADGWHGCESNVRFRCKRAAVATSISTMGSLNTKGSRLRNSFIRPEMTSSIGQWLRRALPVKQSDGLAPRCRPALRNAGESGIALDGRRGERHGARRAGHWGTGAAQDFLDRSLRIGCERSRSTTETRQLACYLQRTSSGVDGQRGLIPMNAS